MNTNNTIFVRLLLCLYLSNICLTTTAQPLKPGDKIPEAIWELPMSVVNHPQGKETITLNEYRGKPLILDFWATWCGSCIKSFPKIKSLQETFANKINILAVTYENAVLTNRFFNEKAGKNHRYIQSIINDSILKSYFPHNGVPHLIWIDSSGTIINTTLSDELTEGNISATIANKQPAMATKTDIERNRPLFLSEHFSDNLSLLNYSIFFKGYYPGLPSGNKIKKNSEGKVYGRQITNLPLINFYRVVLSALFTKKNETFSNKKLILEIKHPEMIILQVGSEGEYKKENTYCYERIVPENLSDSLYDFMLTDLNHYTEFTVTIEKRKTRHLALVRTSTMDKIATKGGKRKTTFPNHPSILINSNTNILVNMLNENSSIILPIINATSYTGNIDIVFNGSLTLESIKEDLAKYDLDIIEQETPIYLAIIKDKIKD